ncbi:MAG TPA: ATP-binding cassette domain-containing protein [Sphingomonas sp.]|nr:ATP-binding cassette domain-containing protein [Sphingomonas sp.]
MSFDIDVTKRLGETDIALAFASDAGLTALFGPSGSGKTSILNMIAGLLAPDRGRIRVGGELLFGNGVDLLPEARHSGYVFQDARLFPHMKVRANLLYGWRRGVSRISLDEVTDLFGLEALLDRWPRTLSGGEAQRVALGRALLSSPRFLLLDEPLASLDAKRADEIMGMIERMRDQLKLPILYVSHNRAEVDRLATQVVAIHR